MTISELYIYPIKSLAGIAVSEAFVEEKGFRYDRRFMLVEPARPDRDPGLAPWQFITQRTHFHMALIDLAIEADTLRVWHRHRPDNVLELPLSPSAATSGPSIHASIWDSPDVAAVTVSVEADRWFSDAIGKPCRLVYMPEISRRAVDPKYARHDEGHSSVVSFADGYPYLLIGQSSLDTLNQRLSAANHPPIGMIRFRPNIVVAGSMPYEEDSWDQFSMGGMTFYGVKPCSRCVLTTIDPVTGEKGREPLRTLATYRAWKNKILFGQNVLADWGAGGTLRIGQPVDVIRWQTPWLEAPIPVPTESEPLANS